MFIEYAYTATAAKQPITTNSIHQITPEGYADATGLPLEQASIKHENFLRKLYRESGVWGPYVLTYQEEQELLAKALKNALIKAGYNA